MGYAKLFSSITESSLWSEPKEVRLLFVSMLARADSIGFIESSVTGLARLANLSIQETEKSLEALSGPDPYSKNPANEGRRIVKVPGGWCLVNYEEYRDRRDDRDRRDYMREYMRRYREKLAVNNDANGKAQNAYPVSEKRLCKPQAEAEAKAQQAEADAEASACKHAGEESGPGVVPAGGRSAQDVLAVPAPDSAGGGMPAVPASDRETAIRHVRAVDAVCGVGSPIGPRFRQRATDALRAIVVAGGDPLAIASDIRQRSVGKPKPGPWMLKALEDEAGIAAKAKGEVVR